MSTKPNRLPWVLVAVITIAFALVLPKALRKPATVEKIVEKKVEIPVDVVRHLTNTIVNNITNTVPVTIEKIMEIPAEIPAGYQTSLTFLSNYLNAPSQANSYDALRGIEEVAVRVSLNSAVEQIISEESARAKFELKLRQLGISINPKALQTAFLAIEGLWNKDDIVLTYTVSVALNEYQVVWRGDGFHNMLVTSWTDSAYGYAGRTAARDALPRAIEEKAEVFANTYLRANSAWLAEQKGKKQKQAASGKDQAAGNPSQTSSEIRGFGSGFFVTPDGYLVSNHHVIKSAKSIYVKTKGGFVQAKIISVDSQNDIALLKVGGSYQPVPLVQSRDVKLGASVFTLGFPNPELQGVAPKLTRGEISAVSGIQDDPRHFQVSVPIQPGNSGGPLVDGSGNVIGIITARLSENASLTSSGALPQNVNYALKSSFLAAFLEAQSEVSARLPKPHTSRDQKLEDLVKDVEPSVALVVTY